MKEQEAIYEIRNRECVKCIGNEIGCGSCSYKVAINALEEIQQYRAIGTVDECRAAAEKQKNVVSQLEEFRTEMEKFGCGGILTDIIEVVKGGGVNA